MSNRKQITMCYSPLLFGFFVVFFNHRPLFNNWGSIDFFFQQSLSIIMLSGYFRDYVPIVRCVS